jgi:hypothetical protein
MTESLGLIRGIVHSIMQDADTMGDGILAFAMTGDLDRHSSAHQYAPTSCEGLTRCFTPFTRPLRL